MAAGLALFGTVGRAATTTRALCAEAGLTQRYFYESFQDVEALFQEVVWVLAERLEREVLSAVNFVQEPSGQTGPGPLYGVLTAYFSYLKQNKQAARILLAEVFTAGTDMGAIAFEFNNRFAKLLHALAPQHVPALHQPGISSQLMAVGLIGATHQIALRWWLDGFAAPTSSVIATAHALYVGRKV